MPNLGAPELIILLLVVLMVFGVGRLPEVGKALGQGLREFRHAARREPDPPSEAALCSNCRAELRATDRFCPSCGRAATDNA